MFFTGDQTLKFTHHIHIMKTHKLDGIDSYLAQNESSKTLITNHKELPVAKRRAVLFNF